MSDQNDQLPDLTQLPPPPAGYSAANPVAGSAPQKQNRNARRSGTWAVKRNFSRMEQAFGTGALGAGGVGTAVATRPSGYGAPRPPVSDVKPLVESDVLAKVGILTMIAIAAGGLSFLFPVSVGVAFGAIIIAFGLGLWAIFVPRMARILAPIYALVEGVGLGFISKLYNTQSHGIVPMAILLTVSLFVGVLIAYRTGLVRISNRFISMAIVATFALCVVAFASILGLGVSGLNGGSGLLVFGVLYVVVAIMDLFVDFELVNRAAKAGVPADAEWYAAFSIFLAVVMLYLGLLRILLAGRR
jgi:uncharacterized YccA/Bax inhibitor family protein